MLMLIIINIQDVAQILLTVLTHKVLISRAQGLAAFCDSPKIVKKNSQDHFSKYMRGLTQNVKNWAAADCLALKHVQTTHWWIWLIIGFYSEHVRVHTVIKAKKDNILNFNSHSLFLLLTFVLKVYDLSNIDYPGTF